MSRLCSTVDTVAPDQATSSDREPQQWFLESRLIVGAQFVLFLLSVVLAVAFCLQSVHDDYFVPLVQRAERTYEDLMDDVTYYERECSAADISTRQNSAQDLFIRHNSTNYGVDQMMTHGSVLFPDLLSPETAKELRQFVVKRNHAVNGNVCRDCFARELSKN